MICPSCLECWVSSLSPKSLKKKYDFIVYNNLNKQSMGNTITKIFQMKSNLLRNCLVPFLWVLAHFLWRFQFKKIYSNFKPYLNIDNTITISFYVSIYVSYYFSSRINFQVQFYAELKFDSGKLSMWTTLSCTLYTETAFTLLLVS